ncbi:MAG: hypothetical protein ACM3UY_05790, partial [Methanocella sp.]
AQPLTIGTFNLQIKVTGEFKNNENLTVRICVKYIDNVISSAVTRTFTSSGTVALTSEELVTLFPSQSIIWEVIADAKTTAGSTDTSVVLTAFGTTG